MNGLKIYWLSDSPFTNTGFSSQSLFLMNGLADKGHDIHYQAHNYPGQTLNKGCVKLSDGTPFKFTMYGNGREQYSRELLVPRIRELKPDIFGVLLDTFMLYPWYMQFNFSPARTAWWFPSDGGGGLPLGCEEILKRVSAPVAMAKYGQRQASAVHGVNTHYIPHGVDTDLFRPLEQEEKDLLRLKWGLKDKFVVGTVARNQGRKMMDRTIKSFALLAKKVPNAVLLLHSDPTDVASVCSLTELIKRYNIENRCRWTGMKYFKGFTYEQMREVFNLMDCFFLSTSGEGFGVPTIEAMSCEVPPVITDYTTTRELLIEDGKCGEPVRLCGVDEIGPDYYSREADKQMANGSITGSWTVERGLIDVKDAAKKLEFLSLNPEIRKQYGKIGRKKCLDFYKQSIVVDKWDKLLRTVADER